jgi:hypothetical protein
VHFCKWLSSRVGSGLQSHHSAGIGGGVLISCALFARNISNTAQEMGWCIDIVCTFRKNHQ